MNRGSDDPKVDMMTAYQARAQALADKVTQEWRAVHVDDVRGLADAVHAALVDEANLELRQLLAQVSGQLELASMRAARGQPGMTPERIDALSRAMDRASLLLDVYMDRSVAAKLAIRIDAETFDLAGALRAHLQAHGLLERVSATLTETVVVGDRAKLLDAIGHLITRFHFAARPQERVLVQCIVADGRVEGFVGLSPSHVRPEQLMDEMRLPLAIEDVDIDIGYTRAIIERHAGTFFVATAGEHSAGFGFHLPVLGVR